MWATREVVKMASAFLLQRANRDYEGEDLTRRQGDHFGSFDCAVRTVPSRLKASGLDAHADRHRWYQPRIAKAGAGYRAIWGPNAFEVYGNRIDRLSRDRIFRSHVQASGRRQLNRETRYFSASGHFNLCCSRVVPEIRPGSRVEILLLTRTEMCLDRQQTGQNEPALRICPGVGHNRHQNNAMRRSFDNGVGHWIPALVPDFSRRSASFRIRQVLNRPAPGVDWPCAKTAQPRSRSSHRGVPFSF